MTLIIRTLSEKCPIGGIEAATQSNVCRDALAVKSEVSDDTQLDHAADGDVTAIIKHFEYSLGAASGPVVSLAKELKFSAGIALEKVTQNQ